MPARNHRLETYGYDRKLEAIFHNSIGVNLTQHLHAIALLGQFIIYTTEQVCDKIYRGHECRFPPVNRVGLITPINDTI